MREPRPLDDGNEQTVQGVRLGDLLSGRYRLEQKIGEGGMGSVYLAVDLELDRKVAVKLLAKNLVGEADVVERFEREARLTAKLDHPNIVPIYDVGRTGDRPFIVMKRLEGDTLAGLLRHKGGLTADESLKLLRQLAAGLDYIHASGFIHRDIKAGNIFVSPEGHATILDFGILRAARGHEALTRTGVVMGTPHYMAPEQALGSKDVDHRVDLYALAVVMFECLTGTLPFEADSELRLIQLQAHAPPPDLLERAPWIARPIAEVMKQALAKRPGDRFNSGALLLAALQASYDQAKTQPAAVPVLAPVSSPSLIPLVEAVAAPPQASAPVSSPALAPVAAPLPSDLAPLAAPLPGEELARPPRRGLLVALVAVVGAAAVLGGFRPWERGPVPEPVAPVRLVVVAVIDAGPAQEEPDAGAAQLVAAVEDAGEPSVADAGAVEDDPPATAIAGHKPKPLRKGKLSVITTLKGDPYWAQVLIDGVAKGRTPLQLELPAGKYQVRVERPGFKPEQREIRVASGKAAVVRIALEQ